MFDLEHICQLAGILIIIGAMFLIFKQKIYLDAQTNRVMHVDLPLFGKIKTNAPTFAVIVLGFLAVIYPVYLDQTKYITVDQVIESDPNIPLTIDAFAVSKQTTVGDDKHLTLLIPNLRDADYQPHVILHSAALSFFRDEPINKRKVHNGEIELEKFGIQTPSANTPSSPIVVNPLTAPRPAGYQ